MSDKPHSQQDAGPLFEVREVSITEAGGKTTTTVKNYFDRVPSGAITAEQVREERRRLLSSNISTDAEDAHIICEYALRGLLAHPGVSSSARAVIEAALS